MPKASSVSAGPLGVLATNSGVIECRHQFEVIDYATCSARSSLRNGMATVALKRNA